MKRFFENLWNIIASFFNAVARTGGNWAAKTLQGMGRFWSWLWTAIAGFFGGFKDRYREIFRPKPVNPPAAPEPSGSASGDTPPSMEPPTTPGNEPTGDAHPPLKPESICHGKGMWIWRMVQAEDGHIQAIIERAKNAGLDWIAIKGADGTSQWVQLTSEIVRKIQEAGIKVLGWVYAYGNNPRNEADTARIVLGLGCDGLIVDAESEFEGKAKAAEEYLSTIRLTHPETFIAYSTFPLISKHPNFPYREFGRYCNAVIPQCYWKMIGGFTPETIIERVKSEWSAWADTMNAEGDGSSVKPILPLGQAFSVKSEDIAGFKKACEGYDGISLWSWSDMSPGLWQVYSE